MNHRIQCRGFIGLLLNVTLIGVCHAQGAGSSSAARLSDGWNRVAGNGDTVCSDGSPYEFFVRPGDADKLLIHFAGGGACATAVTCDGDLEPTPYIRNLDNLNPSRFSGIFDFENAENPFVDYSVVFAPYCTGDVHLGDRVRTYRSPATEDHSAHDVTVHHKGLVNAEFALDWVFDNFSAPQSVFVSGSSAGAIPSPFFALLVAEHYADARVGHLADSAAGYLPNSSSNADDGADEDVWGSYERLRERPEFAELTPRSNAIVGLFDGSAKSLPDVTFAAFDYAEDRVQKSFSGLLLGGDENASLLPAIIQNQDAIRESIENFRSYIASGDMHTILLRDTFYTLRVNGTRLRDWVAELARFNGVADIVCSPCEAPTQTVR